MTAPWPDHVTAALLGTARRPVPAFPRPAPPSPPEADAPGGGHARPGWHAARGRGAATVDDPRSGGRAASPADTPAAGAASGRDDSGQVSHQADAAGLLLEQAAVLTLRRRAGAVAGAAEPIAPAPPETAAEVPAAAAARLGRILAGERVRVLAEWLAAVAERGWRVPARMLPDLLERGRGDRALRPLIARTTGRRGLWLALRNPDWAYLATEDVPAGAGGDVWETGTRGQRVAHLAALRGREPDAAREALAATWGREPAADRTAFLATFGVGLSEADEEFLEAALDDRAKDVRAAAADLLVRLPGAAYGRRMADRARACLRPEERTVRLRRQVWIAVEPPADHDAGMARDGIPFHSAGSFAPTGGGGPVGTRAGWLREVVARTPPPTWTDLFGLPPMEVVCLPIADDYARDVHLGWARAAVRHGDAGWARALLKGGVVVDDVETLADLLGVLPPDEHDEAAADLLRWAGGQVDLLRVLERIPGPWTGALAGAVLTALAGALKQVFANNGAEATRFVPQLCRLADDRLSPGVAPLLSDLAGRHPDYWPLAELTETLRFRHEMLQELS